MAHEILMPKLSSTMDVGTITVWLKEEGDRVEVGEAIFEVMTDKIAIEVEAYEEGILLKKYIGNDGSAPVNSVIGYIGEAGEEVPATMPGLETSEEVIEEVVVEVKEIATKVEESSVKTDKVRATPAARRLARLNNVDLCNVKGSGPRNRVQAQDILSYQPAVTGSAVTTVADDEFELIPWTPMRKIISENMVQSKREVPHVVMTAEVDMTKVVSLRKDLISLVEEETNERLSYLEIITKATTRVLKKYPIFNSRSSEEGIYQYKHVNMGIAVALEDGLIVPVVKNADKKGLAELTTDIKELTRKARNSQLTKDEMTGATFTISSLGKSKVKHFTPIINYPEAAILGIGGMYEKQEIITENGEVKVINKPVVELSLSFDHRVVDGAPASNFLSDLVTILEEPMSLLL
ncbi:pyruvate dehydrogenase E2 component (dihydrolipoamide acetyltransferase) [Vagococcus fluvialis]|uniref:Dihydrolipoamide acetyltransferase component of pyruvate dehydrogenase complex n=1 Tax=Vagococcus fluvialis TaxID=2738 RepID=A0A369ATC3_9ENTE|nr:dihydrolipoamide acetyltransferase family protein [Vagococcus fluvialis]RCX12620.1 pyruvate dehydrogenase E2 component (dihydrolipoamide acetyltransferase) [Vagococcus fluvialis]RSU01085.1 acetoin dehydrogenase [Vagococcus fluvialis]